MSNRVLEDRMWKNIVNPKTGRKVNLNSRIGKSVLRNYIKQLGGATAAGVGRRKCSECSEKINLEEHNTYLCIHCKHFFHIKCIRERESCPNCSVSLKDWPHPRPVNTKPDHNPWRWD